MFLMYLRSTVRVQALLLRPEPRIASNLTCREHRPRAAGRQTKTASHADVPGAETSAVELAQTAAKQAMKELQRAELQSPVVEVQRPLASAALLDAADGPSTSGSAGVTEHFWSWKFGSRLRYFQAGDQGPPLVLLHGFGVGAFHYENNIAYLARSHRVWAVELMGQGESWPSAFPHEPNSTKLFFSVKTWCEQLSDFINNFIAEPAYLIGNSLGGYLAVCLAYRQPRLVRGLVLLNATPFWSVRPEVPSGLWKLLDNWYDGSAPAPPAVTDFVQRLAWDRLRNPDTIRMLIRQVYSNQAAADDRLVERIAAAAGRPDALHAFASIMLSPGDGRSFDEMLHCIGGSTPICLVYGREDPWVKPLWGQRLKRQVPEATYLEVSPAGHCPHHECPTAVNQAIEAWVAATEAKQSLPLAVGDSWHVCEADGREVAVSHQAGAPRTPLERIDAGLWRLMGGRQRQQQLRKAALLARQRASGSGLVESESEGAVHMTLE